MTICFMSLALLFGHGQSASPDFPCWEPDVVASSTTNTQQPNDIWVLPESVGFPKKI